MKINSQTAVGAFVLGGAALAITAILMFGRFHFFNPPKLASVTFKDSISGLTVGAPVNFRGVRIGDVKSIDVLFDATTHLAYIPVTVALDPDNVHVSTLGKGKSVSASRSTQDLPGLIALGLRAELKTTSFVTGQSEVDVDFYPGTSAAVTAGLTKLIQIPTRNSDIKNLEEQLTKLPIHDLANNATATLKSLDSLAEKMNADLPPLIASVKHTSERSTLAVNTAAQAMIDLHRRLNVTLDDVNRLVTDGDQQVNQRGAQLGTLLASSNATVLKAHDVLVDVRSLTADHTAARSNIDAALRDLAAASGSLRGLASDVEQDPKLLLTGRKP